jgi:hypothetical protein
LQCCSFIARQSSLRLQHSSSGSLFSITYADLHAPTIRTLSFGNDGSRDGSNGGPNCGTAEFHLPNKASCQEFEDATTEHQKYWNDA